MERITFRVLTEPTLRDLAAMDRRADRGTMWAVRDSGRALKREARKRAPVYKGPERTALVTTGPRLGVDRKRAYGKSIPTVPGLLKGSIKASRRLKRLPGGTYALVIGPRGGHVHLYAAKQEARTHFMQGGFEATVPRIRAIHERSWSRSIHRK